MNLPKLRFKSFNDTWKTYKFYDCVSIPAKLVDPNKDEFQDLPHIGTANIEKFTGRLIDIKLVKDENLISGKFLFDSNDIIYGKINPQLCKVAFPKYTGLCSADAYPIKSIKDKIIPSFLYQVLFHKRFYKFSTSVSMRTGMPKINRDELGQFKFIIPTIKEQIKIAAFFEEIDKKIELQQEKIDLLHEQKRGFLQKMFPKVGETMPEIRFTGFTDDWGQRNIKEISKVFIGLVTSMTENYRDEGTLLIRNSDIKPGRLEFADNPIHLDEKFAEKNATRRLQIGDVVTVHTGDIGTSAVIGERENGAIGFATINTRPDTSVLDSAYLNNYFNTTYHKNWAIKMSTGDGRSNYNLYDFNRLMIPLPRLEEQKKIGAFINKLDDTIALHQQKLDFYKEQKKGFMQQMFI